jgi:hypothetical protein
VSSSSFSAAAGSTSTSSSVLASSHVNAWGAHLHPAAASATSAAVPAATASSLRPPLSPPRGPFAAASSPVKLSGYHQHRDGNNQSQNLGRALPSADSGWSSTAPHEQHAKPKLVSPANASSAAGVGGSATTAETTGLAGGIGSAAGPSSYAHNYNYPAERSAGSFVSGWLYEDYANENENESASASGSGEAGGEGGGVDGEFDAHSHSQSDAFSHHTATEGDRPPSSAVSWSGGLGHKRYRSRSRRGAATEGTDSLSESATPTNKARHARNESGFTASSSATATTAATATEDRHASSASGTAGFGLRTPPRPRRTNKLASAAGASSADHGAVTSPDGRPILVSPSLIVSPLLARRPIAQRAGGGSTAAGAVTHASPPRPAASSARATSTPPRSKSQTGSVTSPASASGRSVGPAGHSTSSANRTAFFSAGSPATTDATAIASARLERAAALRAAALEDIRVAQAVADADRLSKRTLTREVSKYLNVSFGL